MQPTFQFHQREDFQASAAPKGVNVKQTDLKNSFSDFLFAPLGPFYAQIQRPGHFLGSNDNTTLQNQNLFTNQLKDKFSCQIS